MDKEQIDAIRARANAVSFTNKNWVTDIDREDFYTHVLTDIIKLLDEVERLRYIEHENNVLQNRISMLMQDLADRPTGPWINSADTHPPLDGTVFLGDFGTKIIKSTHYFQGLWQIRGSFPMQLPPLRWARLNWITEVAE